MPEEQPERATGDDPPVGAGADQSSDTLDADGTPKIEGTQDAWTDKAKDVIGPAAEGAEELPEDRH